MLFSNKSIGHPRHFEEFCSNSNLIYSSKFLNYISNQVVKEYFSFQENWLARIAWAWSSAPKPCHCHVLWWKLEKFHFPFIFSCATSVSNGARAYMMEAFEILDFYCSWKTKKINVVENIEKMNILRIFRILSFQETLFFSTFSAIRTIKKSKRIYLIYRTDWHV